MVVSFQVPIQGLVYFTSETCGIATNLQLTRTRSLFISVHPETLTCNVEDVNYQQY